MSMSRQEKLAYDRHIDAIMIQNDVISTAKKEGLAEGLAEGREKGLAKGREERFAKGLAQGIEKGRIETNIEHAKNMKLHGISNDIIANITGLSEEEIAKL